MMKNKLLELALDAGLIDYVDNAAPRHYFISHYADTKDLECFAQGLVRYLVDKVRDTSVTHLVYTQYDQMIAESCKHALIRKLEELL